MTDTDLLATIKDQIDRMPAFGQVQIIVKSHAVTLANGSRSRAKKADIVNVDQTRYEGYDANVKCAADVMRLMKSITDANLTGSLSFSITYKNGQAHVMQIQDFKKV